MNYQKIILLIILLIALFFRIWHIASVPPSPSLDEVSIGYNAYSLLITGKDEYGTAYPFLLRAYDDWRPALYVYLVIPFVWLFGLTAWAVRLPSVVLSVASVLATYMLTVSVLKSNKNSTPWATNVGLIAAFLLAISPWHIYLSRLGHEANAGLAFFILGGLFFMKRRYVLTSIFYSVSLMSYQSEKVVVPFMMLVIGTLFYKQLFADRVKLVIPVIVFSILVVPFLVVSLKPDALIRLQGTNIFASYPEVFDASEKEYSKALLSGDIFGSVRNHRLVVGSEIMLSQYVSHFNPRWLLFNTGNEDHKIPSMGIVYWWEVFFVFIGIGWMIKKKKIMNKNALFICAWFFMGSIPASIATGAPHAMRSMTMLPVWQIVSGIGIWGVWTWVRTRNRFMRIAYSGLVGILVLYSVVPLYKNYFYTFPREQSDSFQYALSQSIASVQDRQSEYDHVVFSNEDALYQSYMFYLFTTKYNPNIYQNLGGTRSGGYAETHSFDTIEFRPILEDEIVEGETLYVTNVDEIPKDAHELKRFTSLTGEYRIVVSDRFYENTTK